MIKRWAYPLLFALTISGYPLFASISVLLGVPSRTIAVPFRMLVVALSLLTLVIYLVAGRLHGGRTTIGIGIFWALYITRMAWDTVFAPITLGMPSGDYWVQALGFCFLPMLGLFAVPDATTKSRTAWLTFVVTAVSCLFSLGVTYRAVVRGEDETIFGLGGRLGTQTLNPITFGNLGLTLIIMSLVYIESKRPFRSLGLLALATVGLITVGLSASRGPVLALGVIALIAFVSWSRGQSATRIVTILAAGVIGIALVIGAATTIEQRFGIAMISRFQVLQDVRADESGNTHAVLLTKAWAEFESSPITGSALEETSEHQYPHNVVVESLMATGIIGGTIFTLVLLRTLGGATRMIIARSDQWIAFLCYQQLILALFAGVLYQSGSYWGIAAVIAAVDGYRRPFRHERPITSGVLSASE